MEQEQNKQQADMRVRSADWLGTRGCGTVSLANLRPGLFEYKGAIGFKTEYRDHNGPEAYCVKSGEYFWGGVSDAHSRSLLQVTPVGLVPNYWLCDGFVG